jgi:hypothetical protein
MRGPWRWQGRSCRSTRTVLPGPRLNVMKLLFGRLKPLIVNWNVVARAVMGRAQREAATDRDPARRRILDECIGMAPSHWGAAPPEAPAPLVVTVDVRIGDLAARLFSTIATLGTAQDITLQELRIESFHPADRESEQLFRALAAQAQEQ